MADKRLLKLYVKSRSRTDDSVPPLEEQTQKYTSASTWKNSHAPRGRFHQRLLSLKMFFQRRQRRLRRQNTHQIVSRLSRRQGKGYVTECITVHTHKKGANCETTGDAKTQEMKMQDWKMWHKPARGGKCRKGKTGEKV